MLDPALPNSHCSDSRLVALESALVAVLRPQKSTEAPSQRPSPVGGEALSRTSRWLARSSLKKPHGSSAASPRARGSPRDGCSVSLPSEGHCFWPRPRAKTGVLCGREGASVPPTHSTSQPSWGLCRKHSWREGLPRGRSNPGLLWFLGSSNPNQHTAFRE